MNYNKEHPKLNKLTVGIVISQTHRVRKSDSQGKCS